MKWLVVGLFFVVTMGMVCQAQNHLTLYVFEGSDWCANCRRLNDQVLSDSSFLRFLEENDIALQRVDFPQRDVLTAERRARNKALALKFDFKGNFPTLVLSRTDTLRFGKIVNGMSSAQELENEMSRLMPSIQ